MKAETNLSQIRTEHRSLRERKIFFQSGNGSVKLYV